MVEAVGAPQSVTESLRAVAHRGTVLLLGAAGISEVDLTPIWYKEAALIGSIDHTADAHSAPGLAGGAGRHSVDRAIDGLQAKAGPAGNRAMYQAAERMKAAADKLNESMRNMGGDAP